MSLLIDTYGSGSLTTLMLLLFVLFVVLGGHVDSTGHWERLGAWVLKKQGKEDRKVALWTTYKGGGSWSPGRIERRTKRTPQPCLPCPGARSKLQQKNTPARLPPASASASANKSQTITNPEGREGRTLRSGLSSMAAHRRAKLPRSNPAAETRVPMIVVPQNTTVHSIVPSDWTMLSAIRSET